MKDSKKRGFTLIELLAVIIILAVIALIAVPLVMSTINDAKKGAAINSAYGFISALENSLATKMIENTNSDFRAGTYSKGNSEGKFYYEILEANGSKTSASFDLSVSYKGTDPEEVNLTISEGVVAGGSIKISGFTLTVDANGSVREGSSEGGSGGGSTVSFGGTYVAPGENDTHLGIVYLDPTDLSAPCTTGVSTTGTKDGCMKWYGLADDGTNLTLILDHNTTAVAVYDFDNKNGSTGNERTTDTHEADWQLAQDTSTWLSSLNARLPHAQEIADIAYVGDPMWDEATATSSEWFYFGTNSTSDTSQRSNYVWLYDYTSCSGNGCNNVDSGSYSYYKSDGTTGSGAIYGYWTDSPVAGSASGVWYVACDGYLRRNNAFTTDDGVRPVITISKSILQ